MKWELASIAGVLLLVAGVSRRLTDTPLTAAMAFVLIGLLLGPLVIGDVTVGPASATVRTLAEATLAVVLFADASRIKPHVLRREYAVPLRLLGIGLPLTIVAGALIAIAIFPHLNAAEAVVLAVLLAPTDAALGQAVVTEPRLPSRIAMVGSGARRQTVGFLGWFGPRGLASIVFAVITIQEAHLAGSNTNLLATYLTVGMSVAAHGLTAAPLARRYARWYEQHPPHRKPAMESVPGPHHRPRGGARV